MPPQNLPAPPPPTLLDLKLNFLTTQIHALSAPLRVPSSYTSSSSSSSQQLQSSSRSKDIPALRTSSIDTALQLLNQRLRKHNKQVYSRIAVRHVAEQVVGLYEIGEGEDVLGDDGGGDVEGREEMDDGEERVDVEVGVDLTSTEAILALPPHLPHSSSDDINEPSDNTTLYETRLTQLQTLSHRRDALQARIKRYKLLKMSLAPFEETGKVQENLVTRGGEVEGELERCRVLVGRVVRGLGGLGREGGAREAEAEGEGEGSEGAHEMDVDWEEDGRGERVGKAVEKFLT